MTPPLFESAKRRRVDESSADTNGGVEGEGVEEREEKEEGVFVADSQNVVPKCDDGGR